MDVAQFKNQVWDMTRQIGETMNRAFLPVMEKSGLTPVQFRLLLELSENGPSIMSHLSLSLDIACGNLSNLCKKLEKRGYILRQRMKTDERKVEICLSAQGEQLAKDIKKQLNEQYLSSLSKASEEEMRQILDGMKKLNEILTGFIKEGC